MPVIQSLRLSFFKQDGVNAEATFVGFANYVRLFTKDDLFIKSLTNTTYYALGSILLIVPLALLLALMLHRPKLRFREFFRLFFFTPNITSGVVVGIIFGLVFEEQYGLLNNLLLVPLGLEPVRWLRDPNWVMPSIILLGVWKFTGINALYFLVFRFVTLPMLRPVLAFVLTFAIIGSYNLFAEPVTLVGETGGPRNAGLTITMYLYNRGFRELRMGYASAIGYTLAIIIVVLTILQLRLIRAFRD
jgi:arabinosaccharide transport system permease protein